MASYEFQLGKTDLLIKTGSLTLRAIPYQDISSVKEGTAKSFKTEWWKNPDSETYVTIVRKSGVYKYLCFNPPNQKTFVETLNSKIQA